MSVETVPRMDMSSHEERQRGDGLGSSGLQAPSFLNVDSFGANDEWSQFVGDEEGSAAVSNAAAAAEGDSSSTAGGPRNMVIELPPQLHPAVSEGMRKISSCYFSIHSDGSVTGGGNSSTGGAGLHHNGSLADILSFLDCHNNCDNETSSLASASLAAASLSEHAAPSQQQWHQSFSAAEDLLYHDILMNVFGFLDIDSLASFSETARRSNFEVFYYLQLQLQRALLPMAQEEDHDGLLSPIAGTGRLARLAQTDSKAAELVVQGYLNSNTSLRQMPLSHSLAYIRQVLMRQQVRQPPPPDLVQEPRLPDPTSAPENHQDQQPSRTVTSAEASLFSRAALLIALMGAASLTMNSDTNMMTAMNELMPPAAELPNVLFRVGFVGSLMSAARSFATSSNNNTATTTAPVDMKQRMKEQAEQFGRNMMHAFAVLLHQQGDAQQQPTMTSSVRSMMTRMMGYRRPPLETHHHRGGVPFLYSPNPYDHLPPHMEEEEEEDGDENQEEEGKKPQAEGDDDDADVSIDDISLSQEDEAPKETATERQGGGTNAVGKTKATAAVPLPPKKTPTGCVGAYRRAVAKATSRLVELVKEQRLRNYKALSDDEQRRLGTALLDACASDDGLQEVQAIVKRGIDVEDFYVASDGTETSALHAAAFHGASAILEFLCQGLASDDDDKGHGDGGLCQVNLKDSNGWTALHFAAGTQSTQSIRILAQHGADLTVEAANGYTPLHWAIRLQNDAVADELRRLLTEESNNKNRRRRNHESSSLLMLWPSPPDLSRFFFGVPSH